MIATGSRLGELAMRIVVPAAAALALVSIVTDRDLHVDRELQLITPARARQGTQLPIRAHLYTDLRRPEGPQLSHAPIAVALRDENGSLLARGTLRAGFRQTMEGALALPHDFTGRARLTASATSNEGRSIDAEATLEVLEELPQGATPDARALRPLQQLAEGPIRALPDGEPAPNSLHLRVAGGACVPEVRCAIYVHVGRPAATLRIAPNASVHLHPEASQPTRSTPWVAVLPIVTSGAEASLELIAERDGRPVARRSVRLPIAQAAGSATPGPRLWNAPALIAIGLEQSAADADRGCIVDAFASDHWYATGTLPECDGREPIPFAALPAGLFRLQLRRDPFAAQSAAVRSVYVKASGEDDRAAVAALRERVRHVEPDDPLVAVLDDAALTALPEAELTPVARYLLAVLDEGIEPPPAAISSFPRSVLSIQKRRAHVRTLALIVLSLCAVTLGLLLALRGLRAASQATRIMADAGESPSELDRAQLRRILTVLSSVLSLVLAFVAIAMYVIARSQAP